MISSLESEPTVRKLEARRATSDESRRSAPPREFELDRVFRLMVDAVVDYAFFMLDPEGRVATWNSGAERIKGYTADEIIGRHFSAFYPPESVATGLPEIELAGARAHGRFEDEGWRVRKDGARIWANVIITPVRDIQGGLIGYAKVTRDLTERRAEEDRKIRQAYRRLNAVMDAGSDGILQIGHDWKILYGNRKAAERLLDFKVGGDLWECFPALLGTHVERTLRRAMRDRVNTVYDNHYAPYDMWYRSRAFPTEDGISIFFTDITSQKTLEDQLSVEQILREKRLEALTQMAAGLAHEINNPLAIIHARASDLRSTAVGDAPLAAEEVRTACESIVYASDRAIRVLRALQGFAREAGSDPMLPASPHEMLHRCIDLLEPRLLRHRVEFLVDLKPDLPSLVCRETQIRQIVVNLLNNALDAIEQANSTTRWIALDARSQDDQLWIQVRDSGPGIEEKFRAHLMEPFFAAKQRGVGMGVGLSLSRTIAQEHGGNLVLAEDTAETCFRLILPLVPGLAATGLKYAALVSEVAL